MANHFPFAAESVHAPVTDAEFRTYVLLCALAWQHHPEADPPYVELTYAELAEKHPKPVAVPTLRVRVMTLVKLGYLRREQVNRSTWRTYVTGLAPLPPEDDSRQALSRQLADRAGRPQMVVRQRSASPERLMQVEGDRPVITLDAKPPADSPQPDRPTITLDASEGDRPMITLAAKPSASSRQPDRPMITLDANEGDRSVIAQNTQSSDLAPHPSLSWGDMIRQSVNLTPYLNGDTSQTPEPTAPKGRLFQRETGDPVLARGRARERHFFQVTSPKPDRPVITQEEPPASSLEPDHPMITLADVEGDHRMITLAEPDRPTITLGAAESDHPVITLVEPDRPVITLDAAEGDRPTITHEPDRSVITLNVTEDDRPTITLVEPDRPVITLEGNLAEGDRGLITQTAEGDRPAITLAPSRAHARVRAHADQDQDQITDLTDPDLIKLDLKNKKSDQSDQTLKDLDRARKGWPQAEMAAFRRTGNVVADADPDFSLSARTGMGWGKFAGADLPEADSDFGLSARTRVGDEAEQPDSDPDFGFSSRTGVDDGTSLPDSQPQAPSRQPSADRSGLTVPQAATSGKSNPGRQASKNPPLTAPQAAIAKPSTPARQPSQKPSLTAPSTLTAPQATVAGPSKPTRQPSKPSSLKASPPPSLDSILASLDESHRALAQDLLSLKPEPMDPKGVAEVMAKPVLTAAWYAWATDPANGVRKPAAYLRSMVRKGYFPPPRPGDEPEQPVSTVDADGVDRSNPNFDVWPGGFVLGKGEIFDLATYVHPSRRNDLVWP